MLKKLLLAALWLPLMALAQSYPSPTYQNVTVLGTLTGKVNSTGSTITNATITGGTISGLSSPLPVASGGTGVTSSTGSGSVVLGTAPTLSSPTVTGAFTATGLVTTAALAAQAANTVLANATAASASPTAVAMPSCSSSTSSLQWTSNTGFTCYANSASLTGATFTGGVNASYSGATFLSNDTSGANQHGYGYQNNGTATWAMWAGSGASGNWSLQRFVSGSPVDNPISASNSTGLVTFADGISSNSSSNAITGGAINNASVGATTPSTGAFTTLSSTSAPTLSTTTFYPTVANNAALQALSTATVSTVTRLGYASAGDAAPLVFRASGSACSLNSGNGDGGSQVKSANSLCWVAKYPAHPVDAAEFGLDLTGATDSTTQLQYAWNFADSIGQDLKLPGTPGGFIKFSTITQPSANRGYQYGGSSLTGNGNTNLQSTVTGTTCAINLQGTYGTSSYGGNAMGAWNLTSANNAGYGLCINQITYLNTLPFTIQNFTYQIYSLDSIRINLNHPVLLGGQQGINAGYSSNSHPNNWNIFNPWMGNQSQAGIVAVSPADFDIFGGDFEGINTGNNTGYCTIMINGNPNEGVKGLSVFGGYYQINGGTADFCITQNASGVGSGAGVHSIMGVEQSRISSTTYVNHAVQLFNNNSGAQTAISLHGNGFSDLGSYVPNSGRQFLYVLNQSYANWRITDIGDNRFSTPLEATAPFNNCFINSIANCINLPDGHMEQWGTATTGAGTPGSVAVTWPLACPTAIDSVITTNENAGAVATGVASQTTTGATLYSATGSQSINWRIICH